MLDVKRTAGKETDVEPVPHSQPGRYSLLLEFCLAIPTVAPGRRKRNSLRSCLLSLWRELNSWWPELCSGGTSGVGGSRTGSGRLCPSQYGIPGVSEICRHGPRCASVMSPVHPHARKQQGFSCTYSYGGKMVLGPGRKSRLTPGALYVA